MEFSRLHVAIGLIQLLILGSLSTLWGNEEDNEGPLKVGYEYRLKQGDSHGSVSGSTGYIGSMTISGEEMQIKVAESLGNGMYVVYLPKKGRMGDAGKVAGKQKYNYDNTKTQIINVNQWPIIIPWNESKSKEVTIKESDVVSPALGESLENKIYVSVGEAATEQEAIERAMGNIKMYATNKNMEYDIIKTYSEKGAYKWMAKINYMLIKK
jgi:hypothetical protein